MTHNSRIKRELYVFDIAQPEPQGVVGDGIRFNGSSYYLDAILNAIAIHTAKNTDYTGGGARE